MYKMYKTSFTSQLLSCTKCDCYAQHSCYHVRILITVQLLYCTKCDYCTQLLREKQFPFAKLELSWKVKKCTTKHLFTAVILSKVLLLYTSFEKETITFWDIRIPKRWKMYITSFTSQLLSCTKYDCCTIYFTLLYFG